MDSFIVFRAARGVEVGSLPWLMDGVWAEVGPLEDLGLLTFDLAGVHVVGTGRFEVRADGARARVFEVSSVPECPPGVPGLPRQRDGWGSDPGRPVP